MQAAARGPVGPRKHQRELVPRREQRFKRARGEGRGAGEG